MRLVYPALLDTNSLREEEGEHRRAAREDEEAPSKLVDERRGDERPEEDPDRGMPLMGS